MGGTDGGTYARAGAWHGILFVTHVRQRLFVRSYDQPQVRPYLMADGGDVEVADVDVLGNVFLRLQVWPRGCDAVWFVHACEIRARTRQ
jgi:hypothetical protein